MTKLKIVAQGQITKVGSSYKGASCLELQYHFFEATVSVATETTEVGMKCTPILYFLWNFNLALHKVEDDGQSEFEWPEGEGKLKLELNEETLVVRSDYMWTQFLTGAVTNLPEIVWTNREILLCWRQVIEEFTSTKTGVISDLEQIAPLLLVNNDYLQLKSEILS